MVAQQGEKSNVGRDRLGPLPRLGRGTSKRRVKGGGKARRRQEKEKGQRGNDVIREERNRKKRVEGRK